MDTGSMEKREFTITICDDNSLQICVGGYCIRKPIVDWHEQAKGHPEAEKPTCKHEKGYVANGRQICCDCGQDVTGAIPSSKCHPPVEKPGETDKIYINHEHFQKLAEGVIKRLGHLGGHWGHRCELVKKELIKVYEAGVDIGYAEGYEEAIRSSSTEEVAIPRVAPEGGASQLKKEAETKNLKDS